MNKINTLKWVAVLVTLLGLTASCDEDSLTIGSGIIGGNNFETSVFEDTQVVSYSARTARVQTNGLGTYQLGIYNDPIYGKTTSNVLSQVFLNVPAANFGNNPEIQSVVLSVPYFSTLDITAEETNTYNLDSVYGNAPVKLSVYRSNYFLRDFDPETGFEEPQKYYSDQGNLFESFLGDLLYEDPSFMPSTEIFTINEGEADEEVLTPRLRVELPIDYWTELILEREGSAELSSNSNWIDFFRGIYFKVEPLTDEGVLFYFDISEATIEIDYRNEVIDVADTDDDGDTTDIIFVNEDFDLTFGGNTINVFDSEFPFEIESLLADQDTENGEERLYLKGGDGSIGLIDLFGPDNDGDGEADQLTDLKENDWLINEANLIVYVDRDQVPGGDTEPERLFLYDMDNGRVLIDYELDNTFANSANDLKSGHLGILNRDDSDNGLSYRLRLTTHISNVLRNDSTNVRLGLAVAHNVIATNFVEAQSGNPDINAVPSGGVNSPEGTVVHGNASAVEAKRLKLIIYYTDPE